MGDSGRKIYSSYNGVLERIRFRVYDMQNGYYRLDSLSFVKFPECMLSLTSLFIFGRQHFVYNKT